MVRKRTCSCRDPLGSLINVRRSFDNPALREAADRSERFVCSYAGRDRASMSATALSVRAPHSVRIPCLRTGSGHPAPTEGPLLQPSGGGGGGGGRWRHGFYVWPLPPAGTLAFVCEWPAAAIELTRSEIDSDPLRAAAAKAIVLWEDEPGRGSGRGVTTQYMRAVARGSASGELDAHAQAWLAENRSALRQRLRETGIASCPACGNDTLELRENPLKVEVTDAGSREPTLQFECTHCGHLLLFAARKLGYTD
jgi:hypothetical protein